MSGRIDEVRVLLEHSAAVDIADGNGKTAAHLALEHGHPDIVAALILSGSEHSSIDLEDAQADLQETVLADLNSNSTKLWKNTLPDICFVGAPFEGNAPDDTAGWVAANRDLMIAKILEIDDSDEFEQLQSRIDKEVDMTILIPDITADEIEGQSLSRGSMLDRSLRVMVHEMSLIPDEFEYLTSVFLSDALERCSPVSFCFAFRK